MKGTYLGVWCATCKQDCIPMRDNTCGFCGNPVDRPAADRLRDLAERLEALRAETASVEKALKDAYTELGQLV